jgi:Flp pilus assembly protein TadG
MTLLKHLSGPIRSRSGNAAIEFAVAIPIFVVLMAGLVEIGFATREAMQAQMAAEVGAGYAVRHGWDAAAVANAVTAAAGRSDITATPAPMSFCGCPGASGITAVSCTATCSNGDMPGQYVKAQASIAHNAILPYLGVPIPETQTAVAVTRIQ